MLSSRPSYFVERGELDELLIALNDHELQISGAIAPQGGSSAVADRLRRKLVAANRETQPESGEPGLPGTQAKVIRLLPLKPEDIEEYIEGKRPALAEVDASPAQVMAFIEHTYDLTDLASRPLLLKLIVESVLDSNIDLDDTGTQIGPSGLYETYTTAKLNLDEDKRGYHRGALSPEARRMLAECAAMRMYEENALEVEFEQVLADAASNDAPTAKELSSSELAGAEIATDFATCSFVTLEQDGSCRFIHKSFRGFFVARVLKEQLATPGKLLYQPLEREVLYFLGGFAPTQPKVGNDLWKAFKHADPAETVLRRNLLVAYLYTTPDHREHVISDGHISGADFTRLSFMKTEFKQTRWSGATVKQLELKLVRWREVSMEDCHLVNVATRGGSAELELSETAVETLESDGSVLRLQLANSSIGKAEIRGGLLRANGASAEIKNLRLEDCEARFLEGNLSLTRIEAARSQLALGYSAPESGLKATDSFLSYSGNQAEIANWELVDCVTVTSTTPRARARSWSVPPSDQTIEGTTNTILIAPKGVDAYLLESLSVGVFGKLGALAGTILDGAPRAWGLLNAEKALGDRGIAVGTGGLRVGDLVFVGERRYESLINAEGMLSAMARLEALVDLSLMDESPSPGWLDELAQTRTRVRVQFQEVLEEPWSTYKPS